MLGRPIETPLDFDFILFGFHVRVSGLFWLTALLLGFGWVQVVDLSFSDTPGRGVLLVLWCCAVFLSILIHELGHALAFRQFGIQSSIVLYHFGGYAMPIGNIGGNFFSMRLSPLQDLWVAVAGPLAQILFAIVVAAITLACGYHVPMFERWTVQLAATEHLQPIDRAMVYALSGFIIIPSIFWAIFNLLPVFPLDGGRVTQALDRHFFRTDQHALTLSLVVAGIVGVWGFTHGDWFLGMFFISFAISNYQSLYGPTDSWR